ncbi:MAG: alanine racemase [Pseudomonadota bacterium]
MQERVARGSDAASGPADRLNGPKYFADAVAGARAVSTIDMAAIVANWRTLAERVAPAACAAVIKASAYGLGARHAEMLATDLNTAGCTTFFVATIDEALMLGRIRDRAVIYVLDGYHAARADAYTQGIRPVLSSLAQIEAFATHAAAAEDANATPPAAAIHIDTGMSRLGLTAADVATLSTQHHVLAAFKLALVVTHPACADDLDDQMTTEQLGAFNTLRAKLPDAPASFANSAAIFHGAGLHLDLVRPGIALYGARASENIPAAMTPAVGLHGRILQVRDIPPGASVGYGATFVARRPTRIATIATGYADGYERALGNLPARARPNVWINGHPAPLAGRVSMDMITADVTDLPPSDVCEGDFAELFGVHQTVDDLADMCGTIGYELLTGFGTRAVRVGWRGDGTALKPDGEVGA